MNDTKPSKSAQKRSQQALQILGEQLINLPAELIDELSLDERLLDAIADVRRMKSHEAIRRQKQFIGKLMRDIDPAPIQALLDRRQANERQVKRQFAHAERWRDRIVAEGREALQAFEAEVGRSDPRLEELVGELGKAHSDRIESSIRKQIFRQIHAALVAQAPDR